MNKSDIGARLRDCREEAGLSRDAVVANPVITVSRTTLQQWENGATEPSIAMIGKLANLYKVSPQYLIFGDTEAQAPQPVVTDDEYCYLPFYDIQASAGLGLFTDGAVAPTKHLSFRKRWVQKKGLQANKLVALLTKGDSMEPTIKDGSVIIVDAADTEPADGMLYVVRIEDTLYVKRVQLIPSGLRLISDNTRYNPLDINLADWTVDQLQICGRVIHTSHDL